MPDRLSRRTATAALAVICALAFGLRVWALGWGLPDVNHPDEIPILNRALAFAKGDLNPHNFLYPTLYFYALFAWEGLFFVASRILGVYQSVAAFEREFFSDPTRVVFAGRLLTTMFGVATIVATYRFGRALYGRATGVGAALLLAASPFAVRDAHYIKHDVPVTFFVVLCQAAVAMLVTRPERATSRRHWLIAGAMAGLALSTQYYAFPIVLPIAVTAVLTGRTAGEGVRRLAWSAAGTLVAFAATSPFFVVDWHEVVRDMVAVRQIDVDRAVTGTGAFSSLGAYLRMLANDAAGWATSVFAVVGAVLAIRDDRRRAVVLLCFPLAFLAFLANTVPMSRYVNPMLPSLAVAAAFAVSRIFGTSTRQAIPAAAATMLVAAPGLLGSVRADRFYDQTDTRSLARTFIERTARPGATVVVQPHGVPLRPSHDGLLEALRLHLGSEQAASVKFQKQLEAASEMSPTFRVLYLGKVTDGGFDPEKIYISPDEFSASTGLAPLRGRQVAYVAVTRYNDGSLPFAALYEALEREAHLVATFSPYRAGAARGQRTAVSPFFHNTADRIDPVLDRPGPEIEIWQIP
jgi:hypothetical protein